MKNSFELRTADSIETDAWLNEVDALHEDKTVVRALQAARWCILAGDLHWADRNLEDAADFIKFARREFKAGRSVNGECPRDTRLYGLVKGLCKLRKGLRDCTYEERLEAVNNALRRAQEFLSK